METDESIYQVAINNGFSDSRRFILTFQSLYGVTPLQYRKASKKKQKGTQGHRPYPFKRTFGIDIPEVFNLMKSLSLS